MKTVRAILIDPARRAIEPIQLTDTRDIMAFLRELYGIIGTDEITATRLPNGDSAWYDDNGLLRPWDKSHFFTMPPFVGSLVGRWVIMRSRDRHDIQDDELIEWTEMLDCQTRIDELAALVRWIEPQNAAAPAPTMQRMNLDGTPAGPVEKLDPAGPRIWTYNDNPGNRSDE